MLAAAAALMRQRADEIGAGLTREEGKPLPEARGEVLRAADVLEYFAGEASRPIGVTLPSYRPATRIQTTRHPGMRVFEEETFGPVTVVDDLDEAIALTQATDYGLCAAIHTRDLGQATRFVDEVIVGVLNVNQPTSGVEPHAPFGGWACPARPSVSSARRRWSSSPSSRHWSSASESVGGRCGPGATVSAVK